MQSADVLPKVCIKEPASHAPPVLRYEEMINLGRVERDSASSWNL